MTVSVLPFAGQDTHSATELPASVGWKSEGSRSRRLSVRDEATSPCCFPPRRCNPSTHSQDYDWRFATRQQNARYSVQVAEGATERQKVKASMPTQDRVSAVVRSQHPQRRSGLNRGQLCRGERCSGLRTCHAPCHAKRSATRSATRTPCRDYSAPKYPVPTLLQHFRDDRFCPLCFLARGKPTKPTIRS